MGERGRSSGLQAIHRLLHRVDVRAILSVAIIVSLLPYPWASNPWMDALYFVLFGAEFVLRVTLAFRAGWSDEGESRVGDEGERGWRRPPPSHLLLLGLDFLALLSFAPGHWVGAEAARWFRVFRLSRMLLLVGYWAPLVRDVRSVMLRRERARQVVLMGFIVTALSFAGAVILEHVADSHPVDFSGDGRIAEVDDDFLVHLWWAFRQIQDPGNMIGSPEATVAVAVSLALTVVGLFMVSFLIGLGTDVVRELMTLGRLRPPGLRGHTIIVNIQLSTRPLLDELMRFYRKLLPEGRFGARWLADLLSNLGRGVRGPRVVVVGRGAETPDFLREEALANTIYRQGDTDAGSFFVRADAGAAQRVVLLADLGAPDPDAETIRTLVTLVARYRESDALRQQARPRARLVIAEVLDESNVVAARAAIAGGGSDVRAFVVPTERLIALFVACVARRPGVGPLLVDLLTSRGHELFTCFFDMPGLAYACATPPRLADRPSEAMRQLVAHGLAQSPESRVIPVGVFVGDGARAPIGEARRGEGGVDGMAKLCINPLASTSAERTIGFVALASSFAHVRALAERLRERDGGQVPPADVGDPGSTPRLERTPVAPLRKVLICGFRAATVTLIEALALADRAAEILVLVRDEEARRAAIDDFDAHSHMVRQALLAGFHGIFVPRASAGNGDEFEYRRTTEAEGHGARIRLCVADWGSSRLWGALPGGFGEVEAVDIVILASSEKKGSDAHTVKSMMKLKARREQRAAMGTDCSTRVIVEVLDRDLMQRLREPAGGLDQAGIQVYSIDELRGLFMFQAVIVPRFDDLYTELMGSWGQSVVQLRLTTPGAGRRSFTALARDLRREGLVLLGVEVGTTAQDRRLLLGAGDEPDDAIDLALVEAIWAVGEDESVRASRMATTGRASS